jgi:hypothetical protein
MHCWLGYAFLAGVCIVGWGMHCWVGYAFLAGTCIVGWGMHCWLGMHFWLDMHCWLGYALLAGTCIVGWDMQFSMRPQVKAAFGPQEGFFVKTAGKVINMCNSVPNVFKPVLMPSISWFQRYLEKHVHGVNI